LKSNNSAAAGTAGPLGNTKLVSIRAEQEALWSLTADRKKARLALPALAIEGHPSPIKVSMVFDAWTVDAMIERLVVLRSHMLPPLPARVRN